jgi:hypothetical protein
VAAAGGTSRRAARAIEYGAMREQPSNSCERRKSRAAAPRQIARAERAPAPAASCGQEERAEVFISSARDDDGSWIQSAMREQLASVCIRFVMCASR